MEKQEKTLHQVICDITMDCEETGQITKAVKKFLPSAKEILSMLQPTVGTWEEVAERITKRIGK